MAKYEIRSSFDESLDHRVEASLWLNASKPLCTSITFPRA